MKRCAAVNLLNVVWLLLLFWIIRKYFREYRFNNFKKKYLARWQMLSLKEKENILFAIVGLRLREKQDDFTSRSRVIKSDTPEESSHIEFGLEQVFEIETCCSDYSKFDIEQMNGVFYKIFDDSWKAMSIVGDYDLQDLKAELDLFFQKTDELSRIIKERRSDFCK